MKGKGKSRQVVPAEECVAVIVEDGSKLYRQGRWWREGEALFVTEYDAARLVRRETVRYAA